MKPLVSVICLCYNHERFVTEAVESVLRQTYSPVQIIVADDASSDASSDRILKLKENYPSLEVLLLRENVGNCKAFNKAFALVKGEYVIDFSTDDIMLPERIGKQVTLFQSHDEKTGVVFSDAEYVDEKGKFLRDHFAYLFSKGLIKSVPQGEVYRDVLSTYFIPSPTMMIRKKVLDSLGGYDEALSYEDFDFWVRSSRNFHYGFLNEKLTRIRKLQQSMSRGWYVVGDKQLHSTYLVCKKALQLNRDEGDNLALMKRVKYEFRQSVLSGNREEAENFYLLMRSLKGQTPVDRALIVLNRGRIPLEWLRQLYHKIRFS